MLNGALLQAPESLREAVVAEIDDDPILDVWAIGVAVEEGLVTLTGTVDSVAKKEAVVRAVKRVDGVRSIANDVLVRQGPGRTDTDIARDAMHRLRNTLSVPETVKAVVCDGYITLDGTVAWLHQRAAAETAVKYVAGVKAVFNDITILQP
jgi:osmotically-inducible protein OsmY